MEITFYAVQQSGIFGVHGDNDSYSIIIIAKNWILENNVNTHTTENAKKETVIFSVHTCNKFSYIKRFFHLSHKVYLSKQSLTYEISI